MTSNSWCNGAAGIVLGGLEVGSAGLIRLETSIQDAITTLRLAPLEEKDHLCCGNMGRIDALIHAAQVLKDGELLAVAGSLARAVLERAQTEGGFRLMFYPENLIDLRLFPGLSGIGYALLRLVEPDAVPCLSVLA
jgi:lantibiotic modifying enzyme